MHIPSERVPMALAELHRATALGGAVHLRVTCDQLEPEWDDPFAGRHFTHFSTDRFREIVEHAGFEVLASGDDRKEWIDVEATRGHMLADTVGPAMRVLIVGLNPSILSADKGYGFARPGNRFWPAAMTSGLVTRARDPFHALRVDGVGMTNLVRRPTVSASVLTRDEYRAGAARLERLAAWLQPRVVCFLGITGFRAAIDPRAGLGWQEPDFAGAPVYLMPNPSGLNAHAKPADFVAHFAAVLQPPS
jgi:TDG/mug DNA glycosylase family protein